MAPKRKSQKRKKSPISKGRMNYKKKGRKDQKKDKSDERVISSTSKKIIILGGLFLFSLSIIIYWPTWNYEYTLDDVSVLVDNRYVQDGLGSINDLISKHYLAGYKETLPALAYRPVPLISYAIQVELIGNSPYHFHIGNIIIYALTSVMLLILLFKIFNRYSLYLPLIVAVLFVVHPVHTEMIANIKNRDEMLGFFFILISLYYFIRFHECRRKHLLFVSLLFFFLGIASKESMITFLAIFPLILYFFHQRSFPNSIKNTLPYILIFIIFFFIRGSVLNIDQEVQMNKIADPLLAADSLSEIIGTISIYLGKYLLTLIFPVKLVADYSYNSIEPVGIFNVLSMISIACNVTLAIIVFKGFRERSPYAFAVLFYFITLSFILNGFVSGYNAYADRFLYSSSLSICITIGLIITSFIVQKGGNKASLRLRKTFFIPSIILISLLTLSIIRTLNYMPVWKNNMSLFQHCVKELPNNARMRKSLGGEYTRMAVAEGDTAIRNSYARAAISELNVAISTYDRDANAYTHLGFNYGILGNLTQAESAFRKSLSINPYSNSANVNLGKALYNQGKYKDAVHYWLKASPNYLTKTDYYYISIAYKMQGNQERAGYYERLSKK